MTVCAQKSDLLNLNLQVFGRQLDCYVDPNSVPYNETVKVLNC